MELDPLPKSLDCDPDSVNLDPKFSIILKIKSRFHYVTVLWKKVNMATVQCTGHEI
jgi:hypothetical protein